MRPNAIVILGWLILIGLAETAGAQDRAVDRQWHHWRGPDANGTAPRADPPLRWDATTNVRWKVELTGGRGSSTPVVWGDRVFVTAAVKTGRVAKAGELPRPDPRFEVKTEPPTHFHKF